VRSEKGDRRREAGGGRREVKKIYFRKKYREKFKFGKFVVG